MTHGLLAEFRTADELVEAARHARGAGYRAIDAYTPFAVRELDEAIGAPPDRVPLIALLGGVAGGLGGYFMQWYSAVVSYPINVGGRPLHSWPSFIPVTFELTILCAALAAVIGMLIMNSLPRLHHPLFDVPEFDLATKNRFFLCIRAVDERYETARTHAFLAGLRPMRVIEVPE